MIKQRILALALILVSASAFAQYRVSVEDLSDSETVRAFKEHVGMLSSAALEGRKAGAEGEEEAAKYVEDKLREYDIDILTAGNDFSVAAEGRIPSAPAMFLASSRAGTSPSMTDILWWVPAWITLEVTL